MTSSEERLKSQLLQHVNTGETGQVIDVFNEDDGEHVEIFIG
ncbi:MAG TPA: hypothetical protein VGJ97_10410 [Anaerolineaceae bacterium]|jgi:hypothetical protein